LFRRAGEWRLWAGVDAAIGEAGARCNAEGTRIALLSTLTHQPSIDDFDAYARYITTDVFLISHLGASILGAAFAILGAVGVTAFLVRGRLRAPRWPGWC
jgi:hypothetical protein